MIRQAMEAAVKLMLFFAISMMAACVAILPLWLFATVADWYFHYPHYVIPVMTGVAGMYFREWIGGPMN